MPNMNVLLGVHTGTDSGAKGIEAVQSAVPVIGTPSDTDPDQHEVCLASSSMANAQEVQAHALPKEIQSIAFHRHRL